VIKENLDKETKKRTRNSQAQIENNIERRAETGPNNTKNAI
jgi:hypothetical protein